MGFENSRHAHRGSQPEGDSILESPFVSEGRILEFHRLTSISEKSRTATCSVCGPTRIHSRGYTKAGRKNWRCHNRPNSKLRHHGISENEFKRLIVKQKGRCAICKQRVPLYIDHCHKRKLTRALLCHHCNSGLGFFKDDPALLQAAVEYIGSWA
jgi:hypothetical protein